MKLLNSIVVALATATALGLFGTSVFQKTEPGAREKPRFTFFKAEFCAEQPCFVQTNSATKGKKKREDDEDDTENNTMTSKVYASKEKNVRAAELEKLNKADSRGFFRPGSADKLNIVDRVSSILEQNSANVDFETELRNAMLFMDVILP